MTLPSLEMLLGFTSNEKKLYRKMNTDALSVADLSRKASLPRMTTHYIIQRLHGRGLVGRVKRHNQYLYHQIPLEEVFVRTFEALNTPIGLISIPIKENEGITLHKGMGGIYSLYERVCSENAKERVCGIQTTVSTQYIYNHFSREELDRLHILMTKNQLIIEDIVEEDFFDPIYARYTKEFEQTVETFLNRMMVTYVLPKDYISFKSDMVIFTHVVVFIDWERQIALEVRIPEIVRMCSDLFRVLKAQAKKVLFKDLAKKYVGR